MASLFVETTVQKYSVEFPTFLETNCSSPAPVVLAIPVKFFKLLSPCTRTTAVLFLAKSAAIEPIVPSIIFSVPSAFKLTTFVVPSALPVISNKSDMPPLTSSLFHLVFTFKIPLVAL